MRDADPISRDVLRAQAEMFRLARRDHGLSLRAIQNETGISKHTLASWERGAAMPVTALVKLCEVIPDELTSLLLEPGGKHIGTNEPGDGDESKLAEKSADYNVEYLRSTAPDSEMGPALSPRERANLKDKARPITPVARRVAA